MGDVLETKVCFVKSKKTVLFVAHGLTPESYGGVEVYTRNLYEEFKRSEKIEPVILARTRTNKYYEGLVFGDEMDPNLFRIYTSNMAMSSLRRGGNGYEDGFKDFLASLRPDFVHFQHFLHLSMGWFKAVRDVLPKTKILLTLHEYVLLCPNNGQMIKPGRSLGGQKDGRLCQNAFSKDCEKCFPSWPKATFPERRNYVKECLRYVDLLTVPSNFSKNIMMEKLGISEEKIRCSENGQKVFQSLLKKKPETDRLTLGFLGQINPYKGLDVLLEAMEKIEGEYNIHLRIHGVRTSDPDEAYFSRKIRPRLRKLKQVEYCGPYTREKLPEILGGLDLVVVPSIWWENSPLVIQEAFMAKVPVLCSNIGGMAEKVTDGVCGWHFKVNDSEDLFKKIVHAYENKKKLDLFRENIPAVKTLSENVTELENIYLLL